MKMNFIKKYRVAIISLLFILVIGAIVMLIILNSKTSSQIKQYDNEVFKIEYDSTWKLDKEEKLCYNSPCKKKDSTKLS